MIEKLHHVKAVNILVTRKNKNLQFALRIVGFGSVSIMLGYTDYSSPFRFLSSLALGIYIPASSWCRGSQLARTTHVIDGHPVIVV